MQDCLDSDSRFGIVLIKSGDEVGQPAIPHPVGTVAHITQVNEIRGDRFFVAITGERRFKINTITQHRPYITADVSVLPDDDAEEARPQSEDIRQLLNEYLRLITGLQGGWTSEVRTSRDPAVLSYYIAETLLIDLAEKQAAYSNSPASPLDSNRRRKCCAATLTSFASALPSRCATDSAANNSYLHPSISPHRSAHIFEFALMDVFIYPFIRIVHCGRVSTTSGLG